MPSSGGWPGIRFSVGDVPSRRQIRALDGTGDRDVYLVPDDGDVDAFIKEEGIGYTAMLNDGAGSFRAHWAHEDATAMQLGDVALGDVDSDGDMDAVVTNGHFQSTSHPAMLLLNDGRGWFTDSGQRLSSVSNAGVALGDIDGDGDLDLLLTDHMAPNQVWINMA